MKLQDRIANALYAQAVVDSVGNPFEFQRDINPKMVVAYANDATTLVISDDTQMAMFGFEAIHNLELYDGDIFEQVKKAFAESYIDWYFTQTTESAAHLAFRSGLLQFASVYSVQSPGNTCMNACYALKKDKPVKNSSLGCGSVMRLLPIVSLLNIYPEDIVIRLAQITGSITHKHPDNNAAIALYMQTASKIINTVPLGDCYPGVTHASQLGDGWIAPECVDIAIWAYHTATSFDELLRLSVGHDGDSDSTGAVAGSLWGLSGKEVPQKYIDKLDAIAAIKYIINQ